MTTPDGSYATPTPEQIAHDFHAAYEALAPGFGYSTRPETRTEWTSLPENNRALMIATARAVVIEHYNLLRIAEAAARGADMLASHPNILYDPVISAVAKMLHGELLAATHKEKST